MHVLACLWFGFSLCLISVTSLNITVITYGLSTQSSGPFSMAQIAPAVELAIQELNKVHWLNASQVVLTNPDVMLSCDSEISNANMVSKFYYSSETNADLLVILLSGCSETYQALSHLGREWNALIVTSGQTFPQFQNKRVYPTAVFMGNFNVEIYRGAFMAVIERFSWSTIAFIYDVWDKSSSIYKQLVDSIHEYIFMAEFIKVFNLHTFPVNSGTMVIDHATLLENAALVSRVIVLGFHATVVQLFMITATRLGLVDFNYVYFTLEVSPSIARYGNLLAKVNDSFDKVVFDAYHQMFQLSTCVVLEELNERRMSVMRQIKDTSIRNYNNATFSLDDQVSMSAMLSYFSIKALTKVLIEAHRSNESFHDVEIMAKRFWNRTFLFNSGSVSLDDYGQRLPDYCFRRLSLATKRFEDVLYYNPSTKTLTAVDNTTVTWDTPTGDAPPNRPVCGYSNAGTECSLEPVAMLWVAPVSVTLLITAVSVLAVVFLKKYAVENDVWWKLEEQDLQTKDLGHLTISNFLKPQRFAAPHENADKKNRYAMLNGNQVQTFRLKLRKTFSANKNSLIALSQIKKLSHSNVVKLVGICVTTETLIVVYEFCEKGDLPYVFENLHLDLSHRVSLLSDLIEGLYAIHMSCFKRHGFIRPCVLFISKRLTLLVGNVGIYDVLRDANVVADSWDSYLMFGAETCWTAPELKPLLPKLDSAQAIAHYAGPEADIYSLGMVVQFMKEGSHDHSDHVLHVMISALAKSCMVISPTERPDITKVRKTFRTIFPNALGGIAQNLIVRMQAYALKLEESVAERTKALLSERRICQELLEEMMPSIVVAELLRGNKMEPEQYDCVTVLFSYIVGFSEFVSMLTNQPDHVLRFLDQVFSSFDYLLANRDIYKVETICDTYMVVSGLPVTNDGKHVSEICEFAMQLRHVFGTVASFKRMEISVGINSGKCAAGVVGSKRPRYCLFGDCVNTASRLASYGLPSKIHVSDLTAGMLGDHRNLETILRGSTYIKGKGNETTYWLENKSDSF